MLLLDLFTLYAARKLITGEETTSIKYRVSIKHLGETVGHPAELSDLNDDSIALMLHRLIKAGRTPQTANGYRAKLLALWRFALNRGMMKCGPEIQKLAEPRRLPVAWSVEQLKAIFRACELQSGWIGPVRAAAFWRCLHLVMWDSAERISAVMSARWDDCDTAGRWLTIRGEHRKGSSSDIAYRLHEQTARALDEIRFPERELIFEWPGCKGTLWYRYRRLLKDAGLPSDRHHLFHAMRRSVASHAEQAGGDATALLGHSQRSITVQSYISPTIAPKQQACDILFRPDSDGPRAA
jgi:integrase